MTIIHLTNGETDYVESLEIMDNGWVMAKMNNSATFYPPNVIKKIEE